VYTIGIFGGVVDFDPGVGVQQISVSSTDVFIQKLDSNGDYIWAKSMGTPSFDYGYGIYCDSDENIYTTGHYRISGDFDPGSDVVNLTSIGSGSGAFVQKIRQKGVIGKLYADYNQNCVQNNLELGLLHFSMIKLYHLQNNFWVKVVKPNNTI